MFAYFKLSSLVENFTFSVSLFHSKVDRSITSRVTVESIDQSSRIQPQEAVVLNRMTTGFSREAGIESAPTAISIDLLLLFTLVLQKSPMKHDIPAKFPSNCFNRFVRCMSILEFLFLITKPYLINKRINLVLVSLHKRLTRYGNG